MRTYGEIFDDARDEAPNVDIVEWIVGVCDTCVNDPGSDNISTANPGCPIILTMYNQRTPVELLEQPEDAPDPYHCIEYRSEDDGPGEPRPIPDPPGQPALFPRADFEGVRMYADMVPTKETSDV
jgi:hypothetical protein